MIRLDIALAGGGWLGVDCDDPGEVDAFVDALHTRPQQRAHRFFDPNGRALIVLLEHVREITSEQLLGYVSEAHGRCS